jgi:hypothetical protein
LQIEAYFQQLRDTIAACRFAHSSSVNYDKRANDIGFVKGTIYFLDGSVLHVREFVNVEQTVDRYTYVYQYQKDDQLIFRYDNTEHHRKLRLASFPHHKHDGSETKVVVSAAPDLATVLAEIEPRVLANIPQLQE